MRTFRILMACAVIACCALVAPQQAARADSLLPTFLGITSLGGGLYQYDYDVELVGSTSQVVGGSSFFTIYDFNGFVAGSGAVTGTNGVGTWTPTEQAVGFTAVNTAPPDGAATNVTFHYTGATQSSSAATSPIFSFKVVSTIGFVSAAPNTYYTGQDFNSANSSLQGNIGLVVGAASVPEFGTAPLLAGMLGLGGLAIRKRRSA